MLYSEVKAIILYWRGVIGNGAPQRRIIHKLIREMHKNDQLHQKNTELVIESFRKAAEFSSHIDELEKTVE